MLWSPVNPFHIDDFLFFVSGSPAELSPSTLSPVNHSMGKMQTNKHVVDEHITAWNLVRGILDTQTSSHWHH